MDLDRQPLGREQIFGHDVERAPGRRLEPDFADLPVGIDPEAGIDPAPAPGLVDNLGGELLQASLLKLNAVTSSLSGRKAKPIELSEMP